MNKLLGASVLAALAVVTAGAQHPPAIRVNVPFEFVVGARSFPAGLYIVDQATGPDTLIIKSAEKHGGVILIANPVKGPRTSSPGRLLFHRYGTVSFLSEVWNGDGYGHQLRPTSREHEMAAALPTPENVAVVASR